MNNRITALLLLTMLASLPLTGFATETDSPAVYVIKRGDTLWGLSDRFLKDPGYWPNMWAMNSQITNPHIITSGEKIRIFPESVPSAPQPKKQEASSVQKTAASPEKVDIFQDVAEEKSFAVRGSEGFLMETDIRPTGHVIGVHHGRIVAGEDDIVFTDIGSRHGGREGKKYAIFLRDMAISHPLTNEIMGTKVVPLGMLQLTETEENSSRGIITKSYKEISPGAYLLPYTYEKRREVVLKMPTLDLKGVIMESKSGTNTMAAGDLVYIDLGSYHGAMPGNMLYVVREVAPDQRYVTGGVQRLPQELLGALVIMDTGKKSSTALLVKSIDAIYKGDRIVSRTK
jgi:hypothetical protein